MKTSSVILMLLASLITHAQSYDIQDFNSPNPGYVLPLKKGDRIAGYARCYIDKDDYHFHLSTCSENLDNVVSVNLEKKYTKFVLFGVASNGSHIGLYFYDKKEDDYIVTIYDITLKSQHSVRIPDELMGGNQYYADQVIPVRLPHQLVKSKLTGTRKSSLPDRK